MTTAENREVNLGIGIPLTIDFSGHIGQAVGMRPDYQGSNDTSGIVLPLVDIRQEGFLFIRGASVNQNEGYGSIGWNALNFGYKEHGKRKFGLSLGPMIRFNPGRHENDNSALNGLGDIDNNLGTGGFIEARANDWLVDVSATSQKTGKKEDGLLVVFRSSIICRINKRFSITPAVFTSWGNKDYMQGFYGVDSTQATRSGLMQFNAESGLKDVGFQLSTTYSLSGNFLLNGQVGYQRLLNGAADSPIVDNNNGSRGQISALFGMAYRFL